jgi:hypothetical protein
LPRTVDDKKTRRALRRLARAKRAADAADSPDQKLSEWEDEFIESVEERLEEFGSAFSDPEKGASDDALSARQALKLREIENKAKGKTRKSMSRGKGFKAGNRSRGGRSRDINDDIELAEEDTGSTKSATPPPEAPPRPTGFQPTIIKGGKSDD